jgi:tetratricopeptide (TPR) repeat protein
VSQYPTHHSILVIDVEGFGDPHRNDGAQFAVRAVLYRLVKEAIEASGVRWDNCVHSDSGDGMIVLVAPEVSKVLLLDPFVGCLSAGLAEHNRTAPLAHRFRLRLALDAGEVMIDDNGLYGVDLVRACRMLDATELRSALRHASGDLAVIVSDGVYDGIVRHGYRSIDPAQYHPISTQVKKTRLRGWIHLPGASQPPVIEPAPAGPDEVPHQILPPANTFVDRENELSTLNDHETGGLLVLVGPPGVGKTALALRWAHGARERYPDGQLYADLGGSRNKVPVEQVFAGFLAALGVAARQIPVDAGEQAELYRKLTARRRLLVLLDNAGSAADIRQLLPDRTGSVALVTGQSWLGSLVADSARFITLEPLSTRHGVTLLAKAVGEERVAEEQGHAQKLVELCGGLPIALCVAGARLATRPKWTLARAVADLQDERRRLARLSFGDELSVQAVFDMSYQALSDQAARLYRLMGLHPGPDFGLDVVAAVMETPVLEAETLVEELLNANMLDEPRTGRCRFHDLIRLHAREKAEEQDPVQRREAAVRRMLDWYLQSAADASASITPHRVGRDGDPGRVIPPLVSFANRNSALDWLDHERINLLAAARFANDTGLHDLAWRMADAMWGLFLHRTHYHDWLQFDLIAEQAARSCADRFMEAETQDRLGLLFHALGRNDEALERMNRAAELWRQLDDRLRMASSLERFGFVYLDRGETEAAIDRFTEALAEYRRIGEQRNVGLALISLGRALTAAGRPERAVEFLVAATIELGSLPTPDPYNTARAFLFLGRAETGLDRPDSARTHLESALATMRSVNATLGEADALRALAELHERSGRLGDARDHYERAAVLFAELGNPAAAQALERARNLGSPPDSPAE